MSGTPNVWKVGIAITPYSAVRARQKFTWEPFGLEYLYFGQSDHVEWLEQSVKEHFKLRSGKALQGYGTELFKVDIMELRRQINKIISEAELNVRQLEMKVPYTATSSKQCPYHIPAEKDCNSYLENLVSQIFGSKTKPKSLGKKLFANNMFDHHFEYC
jgi:hypothetical protein